MSAQAHYKDKLDWPLINYLADKLVALEDIGIYCTLKVYCPGFYKDELHMNFSDVLLEYSNGEFEYKITHNSLKATVDKNYNKLANIYQTWLFIFCDRKFCFNFTSLVFLSCLNGG